MHFEILDFIHRAALQTKKNKTRQFGSSFIWVAKMRFIVLDVLCSVIFDTEEAIKIPPKVTGHDPFSRPLFLHCLTSRWRKMLGAI
jgi:hypothetical protein